MRPVGVDFSERPWYGAVTSGSLLGPSSHPGCRSSCARRRAAASALASRRPEDGCTSRAGIAHGMASVGAREPRPSARSRRITRRASGHRRQSGPRCPLCLPRRTGQIRPALSAMRTLVVFYRRRSLSPAAHLDGGRARTACAVAATRRARMLLTTDARCVVRTGGWSYSPESDLRVGLLPLSRAPHRWTVLGTHGRSRPQVFSCGRCWTACVVLFPGVHLPLWRL